MIDINKVGIINTKILRESLTEKLEGEYLKLLPLFQRYNFLVTSIQVFRGGTFLLTDSSSNDEMADFSEEQCFIELQKTIVEIEEQVMVLDTLVGEDGTPQIKKVELSDVQKKIIKQNLKNKFSSSVGEDDVFSDKVFLEDIISKYVNLFSAYLELKKSILVSYLDIAKELLSLNLEKDTMEKVDLSIYDVDLDDQFLLLDERVLKILAHRPEGRIMLYVDLKCVIDYLIWCNSLFSRAVRKEIKDSSFELNRLEGHLFASRLFRDIYFSMGGEAFKSMIMEQIKQDQAEEIVQEMKTGNVDIIDGKVALVSKSDSEIQKKYS